MMAISCTHYRPGAWQIKRLLTEDRVSATSAIARFVGIEAYEAAFGKIDRDLFAEEDERGIWFDDPDLLNKLAMDSLQVAARELGDALEMGRGPSRRGFERHRCLRTGTPTTGRADGRGEGEDRTLEDPQRRTRQHGRRRLDRRNGRGSRCQRDAPGRDRCHDRGPARSTGARISPSPGASPPSATMANSN